jgi:hypothetical protein
VVPSEGRGIAGLAEIFMPDLVKNIKYLVVEFDDSTPAGKRPACADFRASHASIRT